MENTKLEMITAVLWDNHIEHLRNEGFTLDHIYSIIANFAVRSITKEEAIELGFTCTVDGQKTSGSGLLFPGEVKFDDPKLPKYCLKAGGNVTAVLPQNCKVVTEGFKDCCAGTFHGKIPTGSVSGVWSFVNALPKDSGLTIIFDSDGWHNPKVMYPLLKAGRHVNGKINLVPPIEGQPKAGLCEFFKAGYTDKDYQELVEKAYEPDDLLMEWINHHLHEVPDAKIDLAISFIADYAINYFTETRIILIKEAIYQGFKSKINGRLQPRVPKGIIHRIFENKQEDLIREQKREKAKINQNNTEAVDDFDDFDDDDSSSFFTERAFFELYKDQDYISINQELYKFEQTHYKKITPELEKRRINNWLRNEVKASGNNQLLKPCNTQIIYDWAVSSCAVDPEKINPQGLNLLNGVLMIHWDKDNRGKVRLINHSPKLIYTYCCEVNYDPNADPTHCYKLLECLEEAERKIFLRTIASSLDLPFLRTKRSRESKALILCGSGSNGKDALRAVCATLFSNVLTKISLSDFQAYDRGEKNQIANLENSLINWCSENVAVGSLDIQGLKSAITGEVLDCKRLFKEIHQFNPRSIFLFNCNETPNIKSDFEALKTRFAVICFTKTYKSRPNKKAGELQADPRYKDDPTFIKQHIAPAFLNLLIKELEDLAINGIDYSPIEENLDELKRKSCHLFQFCEEAGIIKDPCGRIYINDLWDILRNWYIANGTLEIEETDKGKQKLIWHEQASKYDRNIKAPNQIRQRFTELFPGIIWGKETVDVTRKGQSYFQGIALTKSPENISPNPKPAIVDPFSPKAFKESFPTAIKELSYQELINLLEVLNIEIDSRHEVINTLRDQMINIATSISPSKDELTKLKEQFPHNQVVEAWRLIKEYYPEHHQKLVEICQ